MKKLLSFLLVLILCFSFVMPVFATKLETQMAPDKIYLQFEGQGQSRIDGGGVWITVCRKNGSTSSLCEVFINWAGTVMINRFRYKQLTVKSSSILSPTIYGVFGKGTTYVGVGATAGYSGVATLGSLTIPTGVEQVRLVLNSFQVYSMDEAAWLSTIPVDTLITVR